MTNHGIVLKLLCTNPSCDYSDSALVIKTVLNYVKSSNKYSFDVPKVCFKCKSAIEFINFSSARVEIIENEDKQ